MNTENGKTNEPHKFVINFLQRLDLKSLGGHVALQNLSVYYTWRTQYKTNKLKKDYIEYITKKHETLKKIFPIHVYINRINSRLVFKIKDGYKLELQMPETMKLFGSRKKILDKTKNRKNVPSLEVVEVLLV